jgi:selenocysteine-specific elongation factor
MAIIATAGHVDHGKSALVRALTGTDPDRFAEEKRRGMTLDLGFAFRDVVVPDARDGDGAVELEFVDVPGHGDLVRTMVAGVWAADVVLLVVDVHEGLRPQSEEHLAIAELLAVPHLVVALTKCDDGTSSDAGDTAPLVASRTTEIRTRLAATPWVNAPIIATSVRDGRGIDELAATLARVAATASAPSDASLSDRIVTPRLFVDRSFVIAGAGTVVTGTLRDGPLSRGDVLTVVRTGRTVRVRDVEHRGSVHDSLAAHHRCAVNLADVSAEDIGRGDVLVAPDTWWPAMRFAASLTWLVDEPPTSGRGSLLLYVGTTAVPVRVTQRRGASNDEAGSSDARDVMLRVTEPLALRPGDRVIIRDSGRNATVGGGVIREVDPDAARSGVWRRAADERRRMMRSVTANVGEWVVDPAVVVALRASLELRLERDGSIELSAFDDHERAVVRDMVEQLAAQGWTLSHGVVRRGDGLDDAERRVAEEVRTAGVTGPSAASLDRAVARRLVARGDIVECGGIAFHRSVIDGLVPVVRELLAAAPSGFTVAHLRERLGITRKHAVPLAEALDATGVTRRNGDVRVAGAAIARLPTP